MSTLLQISDTHFGTERPHVVDALLRFVHNAAADAIVISGDVTQRARRAQFAAARAFVERVGTTHALVIPGNHDIPLFNLAARVLHPYANFIRAFGDDLEPRWSCADMLIVCINTTRPARHKDGEVSCAQIETAAQRLRQATSEQLRVVVTHQPVHVIRSSDLKNLLHGHEAAVKAWSQAGADLILGGHIHLPYVRDLTSVHKLARRTWAVQAGTAVSRRVRGGIPNSVNLVRHRAMEPACIVERWDFHSRAGEFERVDSQRLMLDRPVATA